MPQLAKVLLGLILLAFILVFIAVLVDIKTGRGWGLTLVSLTGAALVIAGDLTNVHYLDTGHYTYVGPGLVLAITILFDTCIYVIVSAAGLLVAATSRHWRWLIAIAAGLLPVLVLVIGGMYPTSASTYDRYKMPFYLALLCPLALCLLYSLARTRNRAGSPYRESIGLRP